METNSFRKPRLPHREHLVTAGRGLHPLLLTSQEWGQAPALFPSLLHLTAQQARSYPGLTRTSGQLNPLTHLLHRRIFKLDPNETPVAT